MYARSLLMTACVSTSLSGATLLHHWKFDEASGSSVADSVGSANMLINGSSTGWTNGKDVEEHLHFNDMAYELGAVVARTTCSRVYKTEYIKLSIPLPHSACCLLCTSLRFYLESLPR